MKFTIPLGALHSLRDHYRLVVVGGGAAGCAVASKFSRILPRQPKQIAVIEPTTTHYYQPGLTLAAAGLMSFEQLHRDEKSVLSRDVDWIQKSLRSVLPENNEIVLPDGHVISYDFLVLATGLELRYEMIKGLPLGRESVLQLPSVCSIYFPEGAKKTKEELNKFSGGTALFTFPATPIKCAGAPQKICYLAEEIFREKGIRSNSRVVYCTSLGRIFGVPKYADELERIIAKRGIELYTRLNLIEVRSDQRKAIFELLDDNGKSTEERKEFEYTFLHIGPPCSPVAALREHAEKQNKSNEMRQLTDAQGWVKVNPLTLQSPDFPNVFAIGDCANTPNAKTAAAVSSQLKALSRNLQDAMAKKRLSAEYDGYASCPLVVDRQHAILAEFSPKGLLETFPFDQSKPSRLSFVLKRYFMPLLYWKFLLNGRWEGPAALRRVFSKMKKQST